MVSSTVSSMLLFLILLFLVFLHMDEALGEQTQLYKLEETNPPDQLMVQRRVLGVNFLSEFFFKFIKPEYLKVGKSYQRVELKIYQKAYKKFQEVLQKRKNTISQANLKKAQALLKKKQEDFEKKLEYLGKIQDLLNEVIKQVPPPPPKIPSNLLNIPPPPRMFH